jgi:DNA mismatch endonuclease (patch repair protein)
VHGCFWHQHTCRDGRKPKSNSDYWKPKLARNVARDKAHKAELTKSGWEVLTVWECETKTLETLQPRLQRFLGDARVK